MRLAFYKGSYKKPVVFEARFRQESEAENTAHFLSRKSKVNLPIICITGLLTP